MKRERRLSLTTGPLISLIPESIGPYVFEEEIGEGAFSIVYRAIKKPKRRRSSQVKVIENNIVNELAKLNENSTEDQTAISESPTIQISPNNQEETKSSIPQIDVNHSNTEIEDILHISKKEIETGADKLFAIKIFPKSNLKNQADEQLFQREIKVMSILKHEHVVSLKNVYSDDNNFYLVMDLCQGSDLSKYIREKAPSGIPELSAALIFYQIVAAVKYCHSMGVVHRDLKPQNILITQFPSIKISDFGLCYLADENHLMYTYCGSPSYSSPEALSSREYDGRISDIWSLGVVLYTLVTGTQPWPTSNVSTMTKNIMKGNYKIPKSVSDSCRSLISSLLKINPKERITLDEILQHSWFDQIFLNENSQFIPNELSAPNLRKLNPEFNVSLQRDSFSLEQITSEKEKNYIQDHNIVFSTPDDTYTSSDSMDDDVPKPMAIPTTESSQSFPTFVKIQSTNQARQVPKFVQAKPLSSKKKSTKKPKTHEISIENERKMSEINQSKNVSFKIRYSSFQDAQRMSMKRTPLLPGANQFKVARRASDSIPKRKSQMDDL